MDRIARLAEKCPQKDESCPVVEELAHLREEVQRLEELSQRDPLTGLYNFRHFLKALESEMERTRRTGMPLSLIMIDLDRFKRINDTYGHEAGNRALMWAARLWTPMLRRIDIACRYGGEEFAVILPGTRLAQAAVAAERLRRVLRENPMEFDGDRITLTASFGVETYTGGTETGLHGLVKAADRFLMKAKARGRNCVCYDQDHKAAGTGLTPEERQALASPAGERDD